MTTHSCSRCGRATGAGDLFCPTCGIAAAPAPPAPVRGRTPMVVAAVVAGLVACTLAVSGLRALRSEPRVVVERSISVVVEEIDVGPAGRTSAVHRSSDVDEVPSLVDSAAWNALRERHYPPALREMGVTGYAVAFFDVLPDGTVDAEGVEIPHATAPEFRDAARLVLREARFHPGRVDRRAVTTRAGRMIRFGSDAGH